MKIKFKRNGINHVLEITEHWVHIVYCGVVYLEAHGTYGYVAGGLGIIAIVHMLTGIRNEKGEIECHINCDV